jgi:hypothetical protein
LTYNEGTMTSIIETVFKMNANNIADPCKYSFFLFFRTKLKESVIRIRIWKTRLIWALY